MAETTFVQDAPVAEEASLGFCTFQIGGESYGLDIVLVQEVIRSQKVFPVPTTPPYVLGVINLRGTIIPIVDIKRVLKQTPWREDPDTRLLILQQDQTVVGWAVDAVGDIAWLPVSRIEPFHTRRDDPGLKYVDRIGRVSEKAALALVDGPRLIGDLRIRG
jgi:purine-binding chemotaxis protein CheW